MSWLCGAAATSALNPQADFRRPDAVSYTFLNRPQQAAYFRAFADSSLGRAAFADIAEQHLRRAAENAGWPSESWQAAPVFIGSSSYAISEYENRRLAGDTGEVEHSLLYLAEDLRRRSGNRQIFSFATACTSSAHALIQADNWLRGGAERAFVLGIENLNRLTLLHFHSLGLLAEHHSELNLFSRQGGAPQTVQRYGKASQRRSGNKVNSLYQPFGGKGLIILGEGAAALALSSVPPNGSGRLKLIAHAANTGGDLIQSDSKAQQQVIRRALTAANLAPETIGTVKTHGIGTADGDAAELAALRNVFGTLPPLLAFKAQIGHTLGASAALETALLLSALQQGRSTDYQGRDIRFSDELFCLADYFGFGGSNTAMVWQWQI